MNVRKQANYSSFIFILPKWHLFKLQVDADSKAS